MRARDGGFSLVELMIAMVLGIALVGGAAMVFQGNIRSAELGQAIATMQANARFALDEIAADVRAAGFRGCASVTDTPLGVQMPSPPLDAASPRASAVFGAVVDEDGWVPNEPPGYTPPTDRAVPIEGTDALLVQYAEAPGEPLLGAMSGAGSALDIAGVVGGLAVGDLALVSDCAGADLFRIDTRGAGALGVALSPGRTLSRGYAPDALHPLGAPRVLPFVSAVYYVGDSGRRTGDGDVIRSLYLQTFPYGDTDNPPLELAEGVDQLQLLFGQRDPADGSVRLVRPDDAAYDPERATSVRIGILMSSLERLDRGGVGRVFELAGRSVRPEGDTSVADAAFHPDDGRLRIGFERSVTVRNRALAGLEP